MSSAISGSLNLSRAQSQIPIDEAGAASNIQNFSTYDAVELIGYVFVDGSSADYRASVKLSIVKNGAGSYEVAASDIAGDDYSGSPIVSFSMSGSLLQATLDSALVSGESPSESYIRYALSAPAVGGQDNISIDSSKLIGTIDSGVLPEATETELGAVYRLGAQTKLNETTSDTIAITKTGWYYCTVSGYIDYYSNGTVRAASIQFTVDGSVPSASPRATYNSTRGDGTNWASPYLSGPMYLEAGQSLSFSASSLGSFRNLTLTAIPMN